MTISVTKPSINLREKLNELDFDRVPFQKMPAGSVVQVVEGSTTTQASMGGTTYGSTNLSGSISLTNSSNSVLVLVSQPFTFRTTTTSERKGYYRLLRDGVELKVSVYNSWSANNSNETRTPAHFDVFYLDTPSTTSEVTYTTEHKLNNSAADLYAQHENTKSTIVLMEIAQ